MLNGHWLSKQQNYLNKKNRETGSHHMTTFKSPLANDILITMNQYVVTGDSNLLPQISNQIKDGVEIFLHEEDSNGRTLFYYLLSIPQTVEPAQRLNIVNGLLMALYNAGINPIAAAIYSDDFLILDLALRTIQIAAKHNVMSHTTLLSLLFDTDISGKTPAETAIAQNNPLYLEMYFNAVLASLQHHELSIFCNASAMKLLDKIEWYGDIDILLAYTYFLSNAFGPEVALEILFQQSLQRNKTLFPTDHLEMTGRQHLRWALTILYIVDHPEKKWQMLHDAGIIAHNDRRPRLLSLFNFRLFAPSHGPCDRGAPAMLNEEEEKTASNYYLPSDLLADDKPEETLSPGLKMR
jgi:hypothetical protein